MGTTRRYRATDKTKTAKPKKKVSKRAALIKKVEKKGIKLRTDWSALHKKKPTQPYSARALKLMADDKGDAEMYARKKKNAKQIKEMAWRRKLKKLGILKPVFKKKKMSS